MRVLLFSLLQGTAPIYPILRNIDCDYVDGHLCDDYHVHIGDNFSNHHHDIENYDHDVCDDDNDISDNNYHNQNNHIDNEHNINNSNNHDYVSIENQCTVF
jgi:hypothetical protein